MENEEEEWRWLTLAPACGCRSRSRQRAGSQLQQAERRFLLPCRSCRQWWHGTCCGVEAEQLTRTYLRRIADVALASGDADGDEDVDDDDDHGQTQPSPCFFVCPLCSPTLAAEVHYRAGAELRVKLLQWGRRPFADDRLASEGRFTELFLPVLGCCDRPVCPPVDEWSCLVRCSWCHAWEHCSCALKRQNERRIARHSRAQQGGSTDVTWLKRYLAQHIAEFKTTITFSSTPFGLKSSRTSRRSSEHRGAHPLAYFNAHRRHRDDRDDAMFLCSVCSGGGAPFRGVQDGVGTPRRRHLKTATKRPPAPIADSEIYDRLCKREFGLLDAMNSSSTTASSSSLVRLLGDREQTAATAAIARRAASLQWRYLHVAKRVAIQELTGELPWILHSLTSRPIVLAGTSRGSVLSYSLASDELRLAVDTEHQDIACVSTTESDDVVLSCSWGSGDIIAHDLHTGQALACGVGHERFCRSLEGDPTNAAVLLSSSYDATVRLWDLRSATAAAHDDPFGVPAASASRGTMMSCTMTLRGHTASVTAAHFLPGDSHYVLSSSADHTIRLWDARMTSTCVLQVDTGHWLSSLALSPDGEYLAVNALPGKILLFETSRLLSPSDEGVDAPKHVLYGHTNIRWATQRPCFSPDGHIVAIASEDGKVLTWSTASGELLMRHAAAHPSGAWAWDVAFGRNQHHGLLFSCADDGYIVCLGPYGGPN